MKRTLEVRTYQAIILKALMRRVKGGPHFLLLYQDDLLLQLYIAAMHTRIVSLYHEVVEFGISAKDYEVSSFSMYREASRYTVLLEVCHFEMFGPQRQTLIRNESDKSFSKKMFHLVWFVHFLRRMNEHPSLDVQLDVLSILGNGTTANALRYVLPPIKNW